MEGGDGGGILSNSARQAIEALQFMGLWTLAIAHGRLLIGL